MNLKRLLFLPVFLCVIFPGSKAMAQHNELSFHLDPHILSATKLEVSSPVVMEKDRFAGLGGVSFARFSKNGFGLRYGFNAGYIRARFDIEPKDFPREIFGPVIIYNSLSIEPVKRINLGKSQFEIFGGADIRYFHSDGLNNYGYNYQSTDPTEFTKFNIRHEPYKNKIQPNLYGGLTYIQALSETKRVSISLLQNFGLMKLGDGLVTASSGNGTTFQSVFNSVTDFTGIRIQYGYDVRKKERQNEPSDGLIRQAFFVEGLGTGGLFSINYDRRLKPGNDGLGFQAGLGLVPAIFGNNSSYLTIPLFINHILGKRRSGLETAIGLTPIIAVKKVQDDPKFKALPFLHIGYRLQPLEKGFLLRFGWTPNIHDGRFDARGAGLALGYSFK